MKRTISLVLCLVMVLSLISSAGFATASAAASEPTSGNGTYADPFILPDFGSYVATVEENEYCYYTYDIVNDGTITVALEGDIDDLDWGIGFNGIEDIQWQYTNSCVFDATAGDTLYIIISHLLEGTQEIPFTLSAGIDGPVEITGSGDVNDPFVLPALGSYVAEVVNDNYWTYYQYTAKKDCTLEVTFDHDAPYCAYSLEDPWEVAGTPGVKSITVEVTAGDTLYMRIGQADFEDGTIPFTIAEYVPDQGGNDLPSPEITEGNGRKGNPFVLPSYGKYVAETDEDMGVNSLYYIFNITQDDTITLTFDYDEIYVKYSLEDMDSLDGDPYEDTITLEVQAGDTLYLEIKDFWSETATIPFTITGANSGSGEGGSELPSPEITEGNGRQVNPYVLPSYGKYVAQPDEDTGMLSVYYIFNVTQDDTITLTFDHDEIWCRYSLEGFTDMEGEEYEDTITLEVQAGDTLYLRICTAWQESATIPFTMTGANTDSGSGEGGGESGELPSPEITEGAGTNGNPYIIPSCGNYVATVKNGAYVYYTYQVKTDCQITVTIEGEELDWGIGTEGFSWSTLESLEIASYTISVKAGDTLYLVISDYLSGTVEHPFTLTGDGENPGENPGDNEEPDDIEMPEITEGTGTKSDPYVMPGFGGYNATITDSGYTYYTYQVQKTGTITIFTDADKMDWGVSTIDFNDAENEWTQKSTLTISVTAGDTLYLTVSTFKDGPIDILFEMTEGAPDVLIGQGTKNDPYVIPGAGNYVATIIDYKYSYYIYQVTNDGKITVTLNGDELDWGMGTVSFNYGDIEWTEDASMTIDVKAGDTLYLAISSYMDGTIVYPFALTIEATSAPTVDPDEEAAQAVIELINGIGEVTLNSENAITTARAAYEALNNKALVTNLETLEAAEARLQELKDEAAQAAADQAAAEAVINQINNIGEVTLASKAAIDAARAAFEALTDAQQALVTNQETLTAAETKLAELQAQADQDAIDQAAASGVDALINAIGEVTLTKEADITAARAAFEALTDAQQALVTNLETLEAAEARLQELKDEAAQAAADKAAADAVAALIDAIGTVTLESQNEIEAARAAYEALTDAQQALVTNLETLEAAEATLEDLLSTPVVPDGDYSFLVFTLMALSMAAIVVMTLKKKVF